jgi:hypothetical protein
MWLPGILCVLVLSSMAWSAPVDTTTYTPDPGGAFRRSAVLPGWGQFYNRRPVRGSVYGALFGGSMAMAARNWDTALGATGAGSLFWKGSAWTRGRNNWLILSGLIYIFCITDAYVDAHLQTFDVTPVVLDIGSPPDQPGFVVSVTVPLRE